MSCTNPYTSPNGVFGIQLSFKITRLAQFTMTNRNPLTVCSLSNVSCLTKLRVLIGYKTKQNHLNVHKNLR